MFRWLPLVWANLKRRKLRFAFTFISILLAFLMYGMLDALRTSLSQAINLAGADRLMLMSKVNITVSLPRSHYETLSDLPTPVIGSFFSKVQLISRAVEKALIAEGNFVAMNNRVSQSVPHLHVHVVPRRRKDGLKGFFWPRYKYKSDEEVLTVQTAIKNAIGDLQK